MVPFASDRFNFGKYGFAIFLSCVAFLIIAQIGLFWDEITQISPIADWLMANFYSLLIILFVGMFVTFFIGINQKPQYL